jgi:hypothetical protein
VNAILTDSRAAKKTFMSYSKNWRTAELDHYSQQDAHSLRAIEGKLPVAEHNSIIHISIAASKQGSRVTKV